jgi:excisionase family DNA binding protein
VSETRSTGRTESVDWSAPTQTVETTGTLLGIGRSSAYKAVAAGEIPHLRIGSRIVVPTSAIKRMLGLDLVDDP